MTDKPVDEIQEFVDGTMVLVPAVIAISPIQGLGFNIVIEGGGSIRVDYGVTDQVIDQVRAKAERDAIEKAEHAISTASVRELGAAAVKQFQINRYSLLAKHREELKGKWLRVNQLSQVEDETPEQAKPPIGDVMQAARRAVGEEILEADDASEEAA